MNYPLISEYIEAIKFAEDNFEELSYLRPVLGDDGLPVMTSGNFAVVFKMKDEQSGKFYAVKCFTKEQEGRAEAYREIAKELKDVSSPYLVSIRYLDKELFVDTDQTTETEFPVLLMDWVEGKTLDKYLCENLDDKYALEMLAYRFSRLAQWLIPQPFAHGDLKPDNILVREDGTLVLVDYDGMYVPAMKGQKARELGSPDFRHPLRTEDDFDEHIDDFSLVSILLSLKAISFDIQLLEKYGSADRLLLSEIDYRNIHKCKCLKEFFPSTDSDINRICSFLIIYLSEFPSVLLPKELLKCHINQEALDYYYLLGRKYQGGVGVEQDEALSVRYYKIAAEYGYDKAQRKLGVCYRSGIGVAQDYKMALYWFDKAAKQGNFSAMYNIGLIYEVLKDSRFHSIFESTVKRANDEISNHNNIEAFGVLGICYLIGKGVPKDEVRAFDYLKKSAEGGNDNAQAYVGYCYYSGKGVTQNKEEAIKWFEQSANQGNCLGQSSLGQCYLRAEGVLGDKAKGLSFLIKSARQGDSKSQNLLGTYYFRGDGIKQDYNMAYSLFEKSAERGFPGGMFNLALCLENGFGTMPNRDKAWYWYKKAAEKGDTQAQKALERFIKNNYEDNLIEQETEIELLRTNITGKDTSSVWKDQYGVLYSSDKQRLIKGTDVDEYQIINGTSVICDDAFGGLKNLCSIIIPDSIKEIGDCAFYECHQLSSLIIPKGVKSIRCYTFSGCMSLKEIILPSSLTAIWMHAFSGCKKLKAIHLPINLKSVNYAAFSDCSSLSEVYIDSHGVEFDDEVFSGCHNMLKIIVPKEDINYYKKQLPDMINHLYYMDLSNDTNKERRLIDINGVYYSYPSGMPVVSNEHCYDDGYNEWLADCTRD